MQPNKLGEQPQKHSSGRGITILVVASAIVLMIAIAAVVILLMSRAAATEAANQPADTSANVKNIDAPANLPAAYAANNQSTSDIARIFYYDNATNCGFTTVVTAADSSKSAKDVAIAAVNSDNADGVAVTKTSDGSTLAVKDSSDQSKTYAFDSASLEQSVNVPGVPYGSQSSFIAYKQFGQKVAAVAYACKSESWQSKKDELAAVLQTFTLKTEE